MSIINFICLIGILSLVILCIKFFKRMILSLSVIFFFSFTILSIFNHSKINKVFTEYSKSYVAPQYEQEISPIFNFSKDGKNVVLVFIDSAAASLVNKIFTEKQELYSQFDGFTFFDNVASFGMHTVYCGPSIFGGYEYSPFELNKRTTETIKEKHQEATKVLPKLLIENDFNVTFINPNDSTWIENLNMRQCFNGEDKIKTYEIISSYNKNFFRQMNLDNFDSNVQEKYIFRNAPLYALLCKLPTLCQKILIKEDYWTNIGLITSYIDFVSHYSSLYYLPQLTDYSAKEKQALLMINLTPHTPYSILQPNYEVLPAKKRIDIEQQYYSANILSYLALGNWFESLKENNVYDNTKIIVLSDHGIRDTSDYNMQTEAVHPVLFIKDFNSHGKLKINSSFCTIADVPFFVLEDISQEKTLINPYTKKEMLQNKNEGILVTTSHDFVARDDSDDKTFELKDEHLFIIKDSYNNYTKYKDVP